MLRTAVILFSFTVALAAQTPQSNPFTSDADLARGKKLFLGHCASCHGPLGDGGRGAILARPTLPRASDDAALFRVIRSGLPGTEMPGAWALIDHEIWQVSAYVRSLGRTAQLSAGASRGDAAKGAALFRGKGNCPQCHTANRIGGRLGPDLTEIGARRSQAYLREALLDPEATFPDGFTQVRLTTRPGQKHAGVLLNEDTYSVQIRDFSDRLHSFWKQELTEFQKDRGGSPMPSYRATFSAAELDDVVSYLVSLRGES